MIETPHPFIDLDMEAVLSIVIGALTIVIDLCSATIANAITNAAETIAKAIKEKK